MNVDRLIGQVMWIPHLDLGMTFDLEKMRAELQTLSPEVFQPYRSSTHQVADKLAKAWQGVSLFSPDGSMHSDLTENEKAQGMVCMPTPLTERLPYMTSIVDSLGGQDRKTGIGARARIMIVQPRGSLTWHSHQMDGVENFRPNIVIAHIPIYSPPNFRYSVIPLADFRLLDHENKRMRIYTQNYECGRATMFNCVHMHNVFNDSDDQLRVSLMLYLDLNNPKTFEIVDRAVANYEGEYIEH